jgi:hypothetical protein
MAILTLPAVTGTGTGNVWTPTLANVGLDCASIDGNLCFAHPNDWNGWLLSTPIATTALTDQLNSVTVKFYVESSKNFWGLAKICVRTHGVWYYDSSGLPTHEMRDFFTTEEANWHLNPFTGVPWTWSEVNAMEIGLQVFQTIDFSPIYYVDYAYVEVNYTVLPVPPSWTDKIMLATVDNRLPLLTSTFNPLNIDHSAKISVSEFSSSWNRSRFIKEKIKTSTKLTFDFLADADLYTLKNIMQDSNHPNKLYVDFPNDALQVGDWNSHTTNKKLTHATGAAVPGTQTEFDTTEYSYASIIDANKVEFTDNSHNFVFVLFHIDLAAWLAVNNINTLRCVTLFLHNPYCTESLGPINVFSGFRLVCRRKSLAGQYTDVGCQTLSLDDTDLQAEYKFNQRFFTFRPDFASFLTFEDYLDREGNDNVLEFVMMSLTPRSFLATQKIGFNYCAYAINGWGVKCGNDAFTYTDPYTGMGSTGVVNLSEV